MTRSTGDAFRFAARLEHEKGYYFISIPASVSRAIGKRGPVPVIAVVKGTVEIRASIVPCGGGRHRLQLNTRARGDAEARPSDRLAIVLRVDENPIADPTPADLERALRDHDVLGAFERLPVGKRNHILHYVEEAVAERTRDKRIDMTVEVAMRAAEKEHDRAARALRKGSSSPSSPPPRSRARRGRSA
jgi:Domain of unknown function (DUF1905)/Bacteriocin-protection, YdeI or OmpD-Associated